MIVCSHSSWIYKGIEKQAALDYDNLELFGCSRPDRLSCYACF